MSSIQDKFFKLASYSYHLPENLIAQEPCPQRDQARLLVINRKTGSLVHDTFDHLNDYLPAHSRIVINNSKVIAARLLANRASGGAVEIFLLNAFEDGLRFEALLKPLKKIKEGEEIDLGDGIKVVLEDKQNRIVRFNKKNVIEHLQHIGHIPLPPYIKRADTPQDHEDYQTVYAKTPGSVASPTAGLHFTDSLIKSLKKQDHQFSELTLHINYGTFKPVECADIREHPMHTEHYSLKADVYEDILQAKKEKHAVVAVGTTSCRVLESVAKTKQLIGSTNLFVYPGYDFQMIDALITNFHLPCSTLLMLVCAFGDYDLVMKSYHEAIKEKYRFYSYGDAMLII